MIHTGLPSIRRWEGGGCWDAAGGHCGQRLSPTLMSPYLISIQPPGSLGEPSCRHSPGVVALLVPLTSPHCARRSSVPLSHSWDSMFSFRMGMQEGSAAPSSGCFPLLRAELCNLSHLQSVCRGLLRSKWGAH